MAAIGEIKNRLDHNLDELYQKGYDLGWQSVIENLIQLADAKFNAQEYEAAKYLEWAVKVIEGK